MKSDEINNSFNMFLGSNIGYHCDFWDISSFGN